jgi:hypothetical protein
MSELKARHIVDVYDSYYAENPFGERSQVYLKSEADKEIQRLEKLCENYRCDCDNLAIMTDTMRKAGRILRQKMNHHKYKRCLAMAWWCSAELGMLVSTWKSKIKHYKKWQKRWLELAEKFKDKETK